MNGLWPWLLLLVALYCAIQAVRDFRRGSYVLAAIGAVLAALLLLAPLQSHAVMLEFPRR